MQLLNSKILSDDKTQDIVTKKHKIRNILCFLCVVAFSYYKDGGREESRTPVLNENRRDFYILSLNFLSPERTICKPTIPSVRY